MFLLFHVSGMIVSQTACEVCICCYSTVITEVEMLPHYFKLLFQQKWAKMTNKISRSLHDFFKTMQTDTKGLPLSLTTPCIAVHASFCSEFPVLCPSVVLHVVSKLYSNKCNKWSYSCFLSLLGVTLFPSQNLQLWLTVPSVYMSPVVGQFPQQQWHHCPDWKTEVLQVKWQQHRVMLLSQRQRDVASCCLYMVRCLFPV